MDAPPQSNKFYPGYFINEFTKNKWHAKKQRNLFQRDFDLFYDGGLKFPDYNNLHGEFYYAFERENKLFSFNANVRKFATFTNFIKLYSPKIENVVEIGGGYGGLCEMLTLNSSIKQYYIIDLFHTISVAMTYLSNSPSMKQYECIYMESAEEFKKLEKDKRYIVFINYKYYKNLKKDFPKDIDLFINTNSLVEMSSAIIREYFDFIQSFDDVSFFSSNSTGRREGNEVLSAYNFPYDSEWAHIHEIVTNNDLSRISRRKTDK